MLNPEPVAAFFDALVVGDGESAVLDIADLVTRGEARAGVAVRDSCRRAAQLPGVYVPSLYEECREGGSYAGTFPVDTGGGDAAPSRVQRRAERSIDYAGHPSTPIVPVTETTHDRLAVEIMRGCTRGCRFCQAGMITRPVRERPIEDVVRLVEEGHRRFRVRRGVARVAVDLGLRRVARAVSCLNERLFDRKVSISLPSLRVDRFGLELADAIGRCGAPG